MLSHENNIKRVIVRAWGDEPVQLWLHRIENNRCYVGLEKARRPIGLPFDQVFAFDFHNFYTLRTAWESGDMAKTREIFESFTVDDFACNRYQDNIESLHDQEDITGSGRITQGSSQ